MSKYENDNFKDSNEQGDSALSNEADLIISNLLSDLLFDVETPNLQNKILTRLDFSKGHEGSHALPESVLTDADHLDATTLAAREHSAGCYVVPPQVVLAKSSNTGSAADSDLTRWIQAGAVLVAVLAAAIIGVLLFPVAPPQSITDSQSKKNNGLPGSFPTLPRDSVAEESMTNGSIETKVAPKEKLNPKEDSMIANNENRVSNNIEDTVQTNPKSGGSRTNSNGNGSNGKIALSDSEMVAIIDDQLNHLWKRVGMEPTSLIKADAWLERVADAIVGRLPTAAEKEAFRSNKSKSKDKDFVDRMIASEEFARHWAVVLGKHYLGQSRLSDLQRASDSEKAFVAWLTDSIENKKFIGEIEREMFFGPELASNAEGNTTDGGAFVRNDPASHLMREWLSMADSESRELPENGSSADQSMNQTAVLAASRQFMRVANSNGTLCLQCHESDEASNRIESYLATSLTNRGSERFWSTPASLTSYSLEYREKAESLLKIGKRKDVFFEDKDGRLKIATAGVPNADANVVSPNQLADWVSTSREIRQSLVNSVWTATFDQPLVPVFGLSENEGSNERIQLRDLIASQIQQKKTDIGSIVRWLVLSKAFRLEHQKVDTPWYLNATDIQIADVQTRYKLFATSSILDSSSVSANSVSDRIATWIDSNRNGTPLSTALAQPSSAISGTTNNNASGKNKLLYTESQIQFLLANAKPYANIGKFAERIGKSSMAYPMMVDHAFLVAEARFPTNSERDEASKLLDAVNRDYEKALTMLVNARLLP